MGGLEAKLLAAGLKRGLPVAGDWLTAELRERGVLPESDAETVFVDTERASFVDRPELDGVPDAERLLVVGAARSGKSRVLGEAVERVADAGRVSQIVTPRQDLVSHRNEWAFEYETFDGDVLLVWDDVHEITEDGNLDAFQSAVSTLERVLDEQGHDHHVVAAVRSGNVADLPGVESVDSIRRRPSGLWEPFAVIELGELDESRLGEIASQRARIHEVAFADDDARQTLVEKSRGPSAPEDIDAVIRTQGDSEDDPEASYGRA